MKLHELKPAPGSRRPRKRVGRGIAAGQGKTAGRGTKGQKARAGGGVRPGFEGGQNPLYRRLPKRGFTNPNRKEYAVINVKDLNRFDEGTVVTPELLKEKGIVKNLKDGLKVLGDGDLSVKLTVKAHKFSRTALAIIDFLATAFPPFPRFSSERFHEASERASCPKARNHCFLNGMPNACSSSRASSSVSAVVTMMTSIPRTLSTLS